MVETKGKGFAEQQEFKDRKSFIETEFLDMNERKYDYKRFEFLYIPDNISIDENLAAFKDKITTFFKES
jgi:hypothetical protein